MKRTLINCATGEQTVEDLTDEEIAEIEANRAAHEEEVAAEEAAATAKAAAKASGDAKLKELGLTDEEIAAR
jgi:uncharacterized protein (DUF4415 family)